MYILEHAQLVFPNKFVSCFTCLRSLVKMCLLLLCYSVSRYVTLIWYSTNMLLCWYVTVTMLICHSVDLAIRHSVYMSLRWSVNMSLCLYVTLLICQYVSLFICTLLICQYVAMFICHSVDLSIRRYVYMSLRWSVNTSLCLYVTLLICQYVTMLICHSVDLWMCQSVYMYSVDLSLSICHSVDLSLSICYSLDISLGRSVSQLICHLVNMSFFANSSKCHSVIIWHIGIVHLANR